MMCISSVFHCEKKEIEMHVQRDVYSSPFLQSIDNQQLSLRQSIDINSPSIHNPNKASMIRVPKILGQCKPREDISIKYLPGSTVWHPCDAGD